MKHGTRRGNVVYHWKHGWIPLDHFAALSKAHHSKSGAVRVMQKHGIEVPKAYNSEHRATVKETPTVDHFRMSATELHARAASGDHLAAAELARRAARKQAAGGKVGGKRAGVPFRPPVKPAEPKAAAPSPRAPEKPKAPEVPKVSERVRAPAPAGWTPEPPTKESLATHAERVAKARRDFVSGSPQHKSALDAENAAISDELSRWPSAGPGHSIRSSVLSRSTLHRHEVADDSFIGKVRGGSRTIGKVYEAHDTPGQFRAVHVADKVNRKSITTKETPIGTFPTRIEAHKAVAVAEAQHHNAEIDKRVAKQETFARKAARVAGVPGPHGTTWEPVATGSLPASAEVSKGRIGAAVAAKAQQSFKAGNKTVTIEANLTDEHTRQLLHDVTTAVEATPLKGHDVHFVVPTGHTGFADGAGGFVYAARSARTVYVNPSLANHKSTDKFTQGHETDWHMPASGDLGHDSNVSVLVHELGHVHDNIHGHTRGDNIRTPSGMSIPTGFRSEATVHHSDNVQHGKLTRYARTNPAEGYAEAFMQYHVAGHGSHPAADDYAKRYGWAHTPGIVSKQAREAAATLGPAEISKLTDGHGLSGATPEQIRNVIRAAQRRHG